MKVISKKQSKLIENEMKKNNAKSLLWATYDEETKEKNGPGFKFIEKELHLITEKEK